MAAKKYPQEFKDACVQEVIRNSRAIPIVAREQGVVELTLRNWVAAYRISNPEAEPELTLSEREKLKRLEAENRELRARVEFLGKRTAFFAKEYR